MGHLHQLVHHLEKVIQVRELHTGVKYMEVGVGTTKTNRSKFFFFKSKILLSAGYKPLINCIIQRGFHPTSDYRIQTK